MATKKKIATDETKAGSTRSMRADAVEQIARSPKHSPDLAGQTPEEVIHELQVHQIELAMQAEDLRRSHRELEESREKYHDLYEFAPTGYFTLTDTAVITDVNLTGSMLLGVERSALIGAPFRNFIAEKDSNQWHRFFVNVRRHVKKNTCTLMLKQGDRSTFPALLEGIRIPGSDGTITVRIAISDLTDIRRADEAEEAEKERIKELNCLYGISTMLELPGISLDEILKRTVLFIPPAWQFPDITEACIVLDGHAFQTPRFRETSWMLAREILVVI
ncbi:MAG: PAS domain-containing protein [Methanoregula sp.]|nr:PAS domain-containing protein [Methanoregula sp.]